MQLPEKTQLYTIYGENDRSLERFTALSADFQRHFPAAQAEFFTAPGRTEIIGNHTDHNGGKVLAASINMDTIGAAAPSGNNLVKIISEGYPEIRIDLAELDTVPKNKGTLSLTAGMLKAVRELGYQVSGFWACLSSNVIPAAGVSSSASFEMLLCAIINYFFNDSQMTCIDYAHIGQRAENTYWEKDSGLMDQMACAAGGTILLDFADGVSYERIDFDFSRTGYDLVIINTGKGHADLSGEYSEIPHEMKQAAHAFGQNTLHSVTLEQLLTKLPELTGNEPAVQDCAPAASSIPYPHETIPLHNDRAVLRAFHYFTENERVEQAVSAIDRKDWTRLLSLLRESGDSSFKWLQNCYAASDWKEQKIALALAVSGLFFHRLGDGGCRVHGGGFAGVIMSLVPQHETEHYIKYMSRFIPSDQIYPLQIRKTGAVHIDKAPEAV